MESSPRLGLPLLAAGQLQKDLWHNEALLRLDLLLGGVLDPALSATPPASPASGRCYRVGAGATGDWSGHDGELALATVGGWRFVIPVEGLRLVEAGSALAWTFREGAWTRGVLEGEEVRVGGVRVLAGRQGAIASPANGSVRDVEARASIDAILLAMRTHGLIG